MRLVVEESSQGLRLDVFITSEMFEESDLSRTKIKRLILDGKVLVNEGVVKPNYMVADGDVVIIDLDSENSKTSGVEPENIALDIFYEDEYLAIINKPQGMLTHPTHHARSGTLVNALLYHFEQLSDVNTCADEDKQDDSSLVRPGIVHRLDRETSGLIIVAKDNSTHGALAKMFKKHQIQKRYAALVKGRVEFDEGIIDVPIGRDQQHWDKRAVSYADNAREAQTRYKVLRRKDNVSLVLMFPQSGRTHQLRVHMAHLGHPILGDEKYAKSTKFSRMALHAQGIGFKHPRKRAYIEFLSALPEIFNI